MTTNLQNNNERYIIQSLKRATDILDLFYTKEELSSTEISVALDMTRSTTFRFLINLVTCGFLSRTPDNKYRLGSKLFSLGQLAYERMNLSFYAKPYMEDLKRSTGESSFLAISDGGTGMIYIERVVSDFSLRIDIKIGLRVEAHTTAVGKAYLAYQSGDFLKKYMKNAVFDKLTKNTICTPKELYDNISQIKQNGYSMDNEESEFGLICYGCPVMGIDGMPLGAISISGPTSRLKIDTDRKISALMISAAKVTDAVVNLSIVT